MLASVERGYERQLADNREGHELVASAMRQAFGSGIRAQCSLDRLDPHSLDGGRPDSWDAWQNAREATPEAREWPRELEGRDPVAIRHAGELLAGAGAELGLRGRRLDDFRFAGTQAAEAGAALVRALTRDAPRHARVPAANPAPAARARFDGTVRVAGARNELEGDFLQGILSSAGIPSTWRLGGLYHVYNPPGGARDIYVPASAAEEARALLATFETAEGEPPA